MTSPLTSIRMKGQQSQPEAKRIFSRLSWPAVQWRWLSVSTRTSKTMPAASTTMSPEARWAGMLKLVGWGVDNGEKYWKVANSWNPYWGEKGYFRIRRGTNEGGIEDQAVASSPTAKWSWAGHLMTEVVV